MIPPSSQRPTAYSASSTVTPFKPSTGPFPGAARGRGWGHQLELTFEKPSEVLVRRLSALGLHPAGEIRTHRNRTVMVSLSPGSGLRIHEGYAHAPDEVLAAIGRFLAPGVRRSARAEARRTLLSFPAEEFAPPAGPTRPRREPARPGDATWLTRLRQLHEQYNRQHFTGSLSPIPIRLSSRMKRRLGELAMDRRTGTATEIGISRRHIRRDGWDQVAETMLHEMVHQWQAEAGLPVNHDAGFRKMAAQVGIDPRAVRRDW